MIVMATLMGKKQNFFLLAIMVVITKALLTPILLLFNCYSTAYGGSSLSH
jgi:hydrogenase-4 membrane subunit HyfE